MICQNCGSCCVTMFVLIRDGSVWRVKPGDVICPYLDITTDGTKCKVHDEPWYVETPCHVYGNSYIDPDFFAKRGKPCGIGLLRKNEDQPVDFNRYRNIDLKDLEIAGSVESESVEQV